MKRFATLVAALLLIPTLASAQPAQPTAGAPPTAPDGARGPGPGLPGQMREQLERSRATARTQMLNALTPEHRTLLATVAGGLTIAATPDLDAAAKRIDAALSPNEAQAILAAATSLRAQQRAAFTDAGARADAPPRPADAASPPASDDPGRVLLRVTMAVGVASGASRASFERR